jgi:hypothetical protein
MKIVRASSDRQMSGFNFRSKLTSYEVTVDTFSGRDEFQEWNLSNEC